MTANVATARELAQTMPHRWGAPGAPAQLNFAQGLCACRLKGSPGEVSSAPGSAHIVSFIWQGEVRHRYWHDGRLMADGRLPDRSVSVVPAGCTPRAVISQTIRLTHVYVPASAVDGYARDSGIASGGITVFDPGFAPDPLLAELLIGIDELLEQDRPADRLLLDQLGNALTARLVQRWSSAAPSMAAPHRGGLAPWQLKRACEAMVARLEGDIGLADLARIAGCSPTHFSRAFKQSTGLPPFRWLHERRMEKAKALLKNPELAMADIALAVGFSAQPQFTTAFGRATGITPGKWRRDRIE